jgi:hypothetical protein
MIREIQKEAVRLFVCDIIVRGKPIVRYRLITHVNGKPDDDY